jgi:hypothetical protein
MTKPSTPSVRLPERARTTENVLFCEQRPLTSVEAQFAGVERLASDLREIEDRAIRALKRVVDAQQGYESALRSIDEAGGDATAWLRAVTLARCCRHCRRRDCAPARRGLIRRRAGAGAPRACAPQGGGLEARVNLVA